MLRVTFELLPGGREEGKRTIGLMELALLDVKPDGTGDYAVVLKKCPPFSGALRAAWRQGKLTANDQAVNGAVSGEDEEAIVAMATGHHRTRRGVYDLFYRALKACGVDRRNS